MKYLSIKHIDSYLENKSYASIYANGSVKGMKKLFGWDKAKEIIYMLSGTNLELIKNL